MGGGGPAILVFLPSIPDPASGGPRKGLRGECAGGGAGVGHTGAPLAADRGALMFIRDSELNSYCYHLQRRDGANSSNFAPKEMAGLCVYESWGDVLI